MSDAPAEALVVGTGRMGQHHARCWAERVPGAKLVAVVDMNQQRANEIASEHGAQGYTNIEDALRGHPNIKFATVAVPTTAHAAATTPLFQQQITTLIEKPLAATAIEAHTIAEEARLSGTVARVGHIERFNPAFRALLDLKLTPRMVLTHRVSPLPLRSLDVGVIMDLGIHDIDLLTALIGATPSDVRASGAAVIDPDGRKEDICHAWLEYTGNIKAMLTVSRLHLEADRSMTVFADEAVVKVDLANRCGTVWHMDDHAEALNTLRDQLANGAAPADWNYLAQLSGRPLEVDAVPQPHDQLAAQALGLMEAAQGRDSLNVTCKLAAEAVAVAERMQAACH